MLEKVFHLLTGSVQFEILGEHARFLNMAAKSGFGFWGFSRRETRAEVCCRASEYRHLRPVAKRCSVRLRCVEKRGLPFQAARLRKRKGLMAGILCGIGIYWFLNGFVWGVTVTGTDTLSEKLVLEAAQQSGVFPGAGKEDFVPQQAAYEIISQVPGLQWAAVNTDGCFAEVSVREQALTPEITDDREWSNIVAARDGVILGVEAEHGRQEVQIGDTVKAGQLLISGLYQEIPDPYSPPPEEILQTLGSARGSVTAETYREFAVQVSAVKKEWVPAGKEKTCSSLIIFGLRIPLGFHSTPKGEYQSYQKTKTLTFLHTELPVVLQQEIRVSLEEKKRTLGREELKEAALFKLREAQRSAIAEGGCVLREELTYSFPDGMCVLSAQCRCQEEIGVLQKVLLNTTDSGE